MPSFNLVVNPADSDKELFIEEGEDYYQEGMVINGDCYLHDEFYNT